MSTVQRRRPPRADGALFYLESTTLETVFAQLALFLKDDFVGKALDVTNTWNLRDTGAATETLKAGAPNGVVELALTAAVEVQLAGLDWNDQRPLVLNRCLGFEARYRFTTLPAGASTFVIGLCGNHNAAIDTVAESIWFRHDASGVITVEHDDTVHETSKVATGVAVALNEWVIVRIDCTEPTDVRFYVNGNPVATDTKFDMAQVAALALQPCARMDKAAAAPNVGVAELDYIAVWQKRP